MLGIRTYLGKRWRRLSRLVGAPILREKDLWDALQALHADRSRPILVHSSLSACGFIVGGAPALVAVLRKWSDSATLAMPAHSYCYPDSMGRVTVFDRKLTPSRVGAVTDQFWRLPGVLRSLHPSHSLACEGVDADALISGHEHCETPCGKNTPYCKLVALDAAVLMFGVSLDAYTLFHTAEDAASVPYLYMDGYSTLKMLGAGGEPLDYRMKRQNMAVHRRFSSVLPWLEERGLITRFKFGRSCLLLIPHALAVHEAVVQKLRCDPSFLISQE